MQLTCVCKQHSLKLRALGKARNASDDFRAAKVQAAEPCEGLK